MVDNWQNRWTKERLRSIFLDEYLMSRRDKIWVEIAPPSSYLLTLNVIILVLLRRDLMTKSSNTNLEIHFNSKFQILKLEAWNLQFHQPQSNISFLKVCYLWVNFITKIVFKERFLNDSRLLIIPKLFKHKKRSDEKRYLSYTLHFYTFCIGFLLQRVGMSVRNSCW